MAPSLWLVGMCLLTLAHVTSSGQGPDQRPITAMVPLTPHPPLHDPLAPGQVGGCEGRVARMVQWPPTLMGETVEMPCPTGSLGIASYQCMPTPLGWNSRGPDLSNCTSPWVSQIAQKIKSGEKAANIAGELVDLTRGRIYAGDVSMSVKLIEQLLDILDSELQVYRPSNKESVARIFHKHQKRERTCTVFMQAVVQTVDNLLGPEALMSWADMSGIDQSCLASLLLDTVEKGAFLLADNLYSERFGVTSPNVDLEVYVRHTDKYIQDLKFPSSYDSDSLLQISALALQQYNGQVKVVFTLYKNLGSFLSTQNSTLRFGLGLTQGSEVRRRSLEVNSDVISASMNRGSNRVYLTEPVIFTLRHLQMENHFGPNCSFWNTTGDSGSGRWSTQGCRLLHTNNTHTTCACNHLSSYAILMTYQQPASEDPRRTPDDPSDPNNTFASSGVVDIIPLQDSAEIHASSTSSSDSIPPSPHPAHLHPVPSKRPTDSGNPSHPPPSPSPRLEQEEKKTVSSFGFYVNERMARLNNRQHISEVEPEILEVISKAEKKN